MKELYQHLGYEKCRKEPENITMGTGQNNITNIIRYFNAQFIYFFEYFTQSHKLRKFTLIYIYTLYIYVFIFYLITT